MDNMFIKPDELDDDRLLYWARHFGNRFLTLQKMLTRAQGHYEAYLAEVKERGLMDEYMRRRNG